MVPKSTGIGVILKFFKEITNERKFKGKG